MPSNESTPSDGHATQHECRQICREGVSLSLNHCDGYNAYDEYSDYDLLCSPNS